MRTWSPYQAICSPSPKYRHAQRCGVSDQDRASLRLAALLHDVGKIGIPDAILTKPGHLTADEREVINGGFTVLSWTTTGAQECLASGGWTGTRGPDGSESIGPIRASTTYALNCSGPGGNTIEMVSVSALGSISISWRAPTQTVDGSPLTDLAGYRIYYGSASRNYLTIVELDDPMAQDYTFTAASGDYFVAMTALDSQDNESAYSNEILRSVP